MARFRWCEHTSGFVLISGDELGGLVGWVVGGWVGLRVGGWGVGGLGGWVGGLG